MTWTYTAPTEPGWYWKRCNRWKMEVVYVFSGNGCYVMPGSEDVHRTSVENGDQWWPVRLEPPDAMGGGTNDG